MCNENKLTSTQIYYTLCLNNPNSFSILDLNNPLRLYSQGLRSGLCVYMNNAPANISNLIVKNISNLTQNLDNLYTTFGMNDTIYNDINYFNIYPYFNFTIPQKYNTLNLNSSNIFNSIYIMNYTVNI